MGATVTKKDKDFSRLLKVMRAEIEHAFPNLQPDSNLILYKPSTKETRIYKVEIIGDSRDDYVEGLANLTFLKGEDKAIEHGDGIACNVAATYGPKPKKNEWIATIHFN